MKFYNIQHYKDCHVVTTCSDDLREGDVLDEWGDWYEKHFEADFQDLFALENIDPRMTNYSYAAIILDCVEEYKIASLLKSMGYVLTTQLDAVKLLKDDISNLPFG